MGFAVVGLSLLGVSFLFLIYGGYGALFGTSNVADSAELSLGQLQAALWEWVLGHL